MESVHPMKVQGDILVVDDDLSTRQALSALMEREGHKVRCAPSGQTALLSAQDDPPNLILLDIRLPDMDGLQVCRRLKEDHRTRDIPVILLSFLDRTEDKIKGFEAGGVDYITKPFQAKEVIARIGTHLALKQLRDELERRVADRTAGLEQAVDELATTNAQLRQESARREQSESALQGRLRFEQMLLDLSARFVNMAPERVDSEIERGLQQLVEFFDVDRCGLLQMSQDGTRFQITHVALAEGIPGLPAREDLSASLFPWMYHRVVVQREAMSVSTLEDMPPEASVDKRKFREWGVQSHLHIPVIIGSRTYIIGINAVRKERAWPEEYIPRLRLLGEIFVNALERRRARLELDERLRFEQLISALSASFVDLKPEAVDAEVERWLHPIAEFFSVDRCNIGVFSEDRTRTTRAFQYCREQIESAAESLSMEQLPWYLEQLSQGQPVVLNRLDDLPEEAERERLYFVAKGLKSVLSMPMIRQGSPLGFCALVSVREGRVWPQELVQRLRLVGEVFANALAHKQSDQALRQAALEHRTILDFTYDWEYWVNPDGTLRYISPSCERITGYTPWEFMTTPSLLREIIVEEDRKCWDDHLGAARSTHREVTIRFRIRRRDEGVRWIEHICRRVSGMDGSFLGLRVSNRDITERQEMHARLQAAADEWQVTFDSVHDPIMLLDTNYRIRRANAATAALLELPMGRILGSSCHILMHGTHAPMAGCPSARVFQTQRHEVEEIFHAGKGLWLLVSADPIRDAAGNVTDIIHMVKDITGRKRMEEELRSRLAEIENLKRQLEQDNLSLRAEVKLLTEHSEIVHTSGAMQRVLAQAEQVAPKESTVLILGETGTGKEPLARMIHELSKRSAKPLVTVNCAALHPSLIESELFGRERGAYTGAMTSMVGRFEAADKSTIFLDEIGELPLEVQTKLLRVLEQGQFERLGSSKSLRADVRVIAATNRNLEQLVTEGKFRGDLFYRLNVFLIVIPPLRERPEDIPALVWEFVKQFEKKMGNRIDSVPRRTMEALQRHHWPGNIRELRNVIEHAMIVSAGRTLEVRLPSMSPTKSSREHPAAGSLEDIERMHILDVLQNTGWRITGKRGAAELLGLKRTTLQSRMKKLGIKRPTS